MNELLTYIIQNLMKAVAQRHGKRVSVDILD